MREIDFNNLQPTELKDAAELVKAFTEYLENACSYNSSEAAFIATDIEDPYKADFVLEEYEQFCTVAGIKYEVRSCRTELSLCGIFPRREVDPFEFFMLIDTTTLEDNTVGSYWKATKKYII